MSKEALKLALEALEEITDEVFSPYDNKLGKAITALREALAEQPAQQEPVAIALNTGTKQGVKWLKNVEHGKSLYTSPQRTWVGLTDEEYINITDSVYHKGKGLVAYYKAIEAKLRSKNT